MRSCAAPHRAEQPFDEESLNRGQQTKRALFDAFDLRVVYDKDGDRLSISATLTEAVASILHNDLEPLWQEALRGTDSHTSTTLREDYWLEG